MAEYTWFRREVGDAIQNVTFEKDKAYKEALYRSTNSKKTKAGKNLFTYYHLITPSQGQQGFAQSSTLVQSLPREFTIQDPENNLNWFTQDTEAPNNVVPHERIQRGHLLRRARKNSRDDKGSGGTFKRIYEGEFKGEDAGNYSLAALTKGSKDRNVAMAAHAFISNEKALHDKITGLQEGYKQGKKRRRDTQSIERIEDAKKKYEETRSRLVGRRGMYTHDTPPAGVPVTHPPFVGSVDNGLNVLLGPSA